MKRTLLVILLCITSIIIQAQNLPGGLETAKFVKFYKANQADSIFTLFSPQMKAALSASATTGMISQLKAQLGEINKSRYIGAVQDSIYEHRISFDKPIVEFAIFIKNKLIVGIKQVAVEASSSDPVQIESPDNFVVNNATGKLYGTLLLPKTTGKVPVILMISGSGPTDRNMNQAESLRTNAFLMLARSLADNSIATVRYDKRGVGKSADAAKSGNGILEDYIEDAEKFINQLVTDPRFSKVIVLGHSEGATIGVVSVQHTNPAAYISLSGIGSNLGTILKKQLSAFPPAESKLANEILDSLKVGKIVNRTLPQSLIPIFAPSIQPFIISFMKYDSSKEIAKVKIPVLIINGTTDIQIGTENAQQLAKANPKATLKLLTGMNHVLKDAPADRKLNTETYNKPELPLNKELVPVIVEFVNQLKN